MQSPYLAHTVTSPIPLQYSIKSSTKALESVRGMEKLKQEFSEPNLGQ